MKSEFSQNFGQIIINFEGFISNYNPKKKKKKNKGHVGMSHFLLSDSHH